MLTGKRMRKEEYKIGAKPRPSQGVIKRTFLKTRERVRARGRVTAKTSCNKKKTSSRFLVFSTDLPTMKEPMASKISQLARITPRVSSFPRKETSSSRSRRIWALMQLGPMRRRDILNADAAISFLSLGWDLLPSYAEST